MKAFFFLLLTVILCSSETLLGQSPSYYDLTFEADSVRTPFKSSSDNYVFVRSKRGVDGVNTTPEADAAKSKVIVRIVLVFSEDSPDALETREEYNQERWDNLILTYPEFFQEKTRYKNVCQCTPGAGGEEFKQVQGFYIYYQAAEKKAVQKEKQDIKEKQEIKTEQPAKAAAPAPAAVPAAIAVTAVAADVPAKTPEAPAKTPETIVAEPEVKTQKPVVNEPEELITESKAAEAKSPEPLAKKKSGVAKPRRAKDPKACRPAFYGEGDQDLDDFFKTNVVLSKKQRRQAKKLTAELRLQLNVDGTVKKTQVIGENEALNKQLLEAVNVMNPWNAAVRGGVTIKSEVRITLKYDKKSKSLKKALMITNPKMNPKCKCISDSEMFGS